MKPKKEDFLNILKFKFENFIPAHGPILKGKANSKIQLYVDKFKF